MLFPKFYYKFGRDSCRYTYVRQPLLSFHTKNLFKSVPYINQITLCSHDSVNVFISSGGFIYNFRVLTTFHAFCRFFMILNSKSFTSFGS